MSLSVALAAVVLLSGCAEGEPTLGPGWTPNPACAIPGENGEKIEVACPPANAADENPVELLGEKVEAGLEDADARGKAIDAVNDLCIKAGVEDCDVEAILNEQIPYLETR